MLQFRQLRLLLLGTFLLLLVSLIHLTQGQADYYWTDILTASWTDERLQAILFGIRLPRLVIGILAGGALAMAGLLLQTLTRNPLASAGTLGINSGAFLFVSAGAIFFPTVAANFPFLFAFVGSCTAAILVFLLVGRGMEPVKVALTGMIITLLFGAITSGLQLMFEQETNGLFLWGAGTLIQNNWAGVQFALPFIFISAILLLFNGKNFDLLLLGDEGATGLGLATERVKLIGWILAITLAAATVSVVGPIGFIGLMAPHIVRLLGIKGHRQQFIHTFVWGAFLLIAADALARFVQPGGEIPVGAMTAIVGGPWLMYLAYRMGKRYASSKITLNGRESSLPLPILYAALILSTFGVALVSLMYGGGSFDSVQDLISGSLFQEFSVRYRWPRILTAFLVGALLALCGVLLQSVLRNPLGDPSILGITSGGGAGALTIIVLFPTLSFAFVPVGAVVGSTLAIVTILLATKRSYWEPISLALMGVAVSAVGSGIIQILTVKATIGVAPALLWLAGSTYGMNWQNVYFLVSILVLLVPISYWLSKELDLLGLHQQVSTGLV